MFSSVEDLSTPPVLRAGRHNIPRDEVVRIQRGRVLDAVADVVSVSGYANLSVEGIISTAGISRRTFYDLFSDKEDAFLQAYDRASTAIEAAVAHTFEQAEGPVQQAIVCMSVLARALSAEPTLTEMYIVEVLGAGPDALARRDQVMRAMAALIERAVADLPRERLPPPTTPETIIGGIFEVIHSRTLRGELDELPALVPDFVYTLTMPYLGPAGALEAYEAAKRYVPD